MGWQDSLATALVGAVVSKFSGKKAENDYDDSNYRGTNSYNGSSYDYSHTSHNIQPQYDNNYTSHNIHPQSQYDSNYTSHDIQPQYDYNYNSHNNQSQYYNNPSPNYPSSSSATKPKENYRQNRHADYYSRGKNKKERVTEEKGRVTRRYANSNGDDVVEEREYHMMSYDDAMSPRSTYQYPNQY